MTKEKEGKLRYDLLPPEVIEEVVKILTFGATKYGDYNWLENKSDDHYAALMRHLQKWRMGTVKDKESGHKHIAHVICNAIFLYYLK
jgi:ribosomal protein L32